MLCLLAARDVGLNLCSPLHPGENGSSSENSRAGAFLITAPLSHTPESTLRSTNTLRSFALPGIMADI